MSRKELTEELDRAALALLARTFPDNGEESGTEGTDQPDLSDQVKAFAAVSAYHISKSKHLPPPKAEAPFDALRRELHGGGSKRRTAAHSAPANDSASAATGD